ncbi:hypothetical protein SAMN05421820_104255 [Pedobacter steynii]|uniref:DUF1735 domain-containing protein n=1 Tax=Pedobacter steynii TaxID=430522 RepID=A0A1G9URF2_9SPHI|nr:hypothetical protein [Pedobacter steynii]NQX40850.1 hypothetical protein [Pedobacter steynii]SDM62454.1 hypothetical protein SAMN05421820_104255 [Pedobacter steynii]
MKKLNNSIYTCFLLALVVLAQSCKRDKLEDFGAKEGIPASVSVKGLSGEIKKDAENVRIPVEIQLSSSASQAFDAHVALDDNAVTTAIAGNLLPNTLLMPGGLIVVPQAVTVPFGTKSAVFEVVISVTALEKFYFSGKKVAFALKLTDVAKGNTIDEKKHTGIISVDPMEVIAASAMHAVSIANGGGGTLDVSGTSNYVPSVASIGIPLGVSLSGAASRSFTVDVAVNSDTVAVLKTNGVLPADAVIMQRGEFELPVQVAVDQSSNTAKLEVTVSSETLLKYRNNKIALVVQLTGSSRHVVHPVKRTAILLIDPASIIIANNYK